MIRIDIRPVWRFRSSSEAEFDFRLVAILERIESSSKLTQAAQAAGLSYRHAWNLIVRWEAFFGAPLVKKQQGRGTSLTPLGKRLLWAARRAQARLAPELDNLASDFARTLNESLSEGTPALVMHASHDFAIGELRELLGESACVEVRYKGSFDALAALRRGECDVAGFHVPEGPLGALIARRYAECLPLADFRLLGFVRRVQGLIVRPGNPKGIRGVRDLCRQDVRMVNRQRGSGTRALLEFIISSEGLDRARMAGYDNEEVTHGAVAALIAGNLADAGFGVEAAAAHYRLDFIPVCRERYYLACAPEVLEGAAGTQLVRALRGEAFAKRLSRLRGYSAPDAGTLVASLDVHATAAQDA
ncbi:MAG TPA: substrate-binding domain-containing protein [Usitatibacter sp.]|jgi:molybdate transport repressor ModE-like protein|nr:substrate-binding domain-containing protein [Usitatibacter sp.]